MAHRFKRATYPEIECREFTVDETIQVNGWDDDSYTIRADVGSDFVVAHFSAEEFVEFIQNCGWIAKKEKMLQ